MEGKNHDETSHKREDSKGSVRISKVSLWQSVSALLFLLLLASMYSGGFGFRESATGDAADAPDGNLAPPEPSAIELSSLIDEDDAVKGDADAPITIVEWSDFECPFCARFYEGALPQIESDYIETGIARFAYKDFPLNFHVNAQKAAEAAECAGEQEMYYEMHDRLFEEGVEGGVPAFKRLAQELGLDTDEFDSCLDSGEMAGEVGADMSLGQKAGITGTPGFVIYTSKEVSISEIQQAIPAQYARNMEAVQLEGKAIGVKVSGALPFDAFRPILDAMA